ncbi:hypothetical protein Mpal_0636 [Methanosphaerula palustris E1-9c]|uniref:Uncharacterized protein n=2 Tax=Methanosphaerula palustris TaxID=475088 RepID=B8GFF9_METPE|nr:hypothetical protein Mpal_0636 [Methanosphaerula palustris E1-9c]
MRAWSAVIDEIVTNEYNPNHSEEDPIDVRSARCRRFEGKQGPVREKVGDDMETRGEMR